MGGSIDPNYSIEYLVSLVGIGDRGEGDRVLLRSMLEIIRCVCCVSTVVDRSHVSGIVCGCGS